MGGRGCCLLDMATFRGLLLLINHCMKTVNILQHLMRSTIDTAVKRSVNCVIPGLGIGYCVTRHLVNKLQKQEKHRYRAAF